MEAGGSYLRTALLLHNKPPLKLLVKTVNMLLPPKVLGCLGSAGGRGEGGKECFLCLSHPAAVIQLQSGDPRAGVTWHLLRPEDSGLSTSHMASP